MNLVECLGFPHFHWLHGSGPVPLEPLALAALAASKVAGAWAQAASPRLRRQPKRPGAGDSAAKIGPSYTLW